MRQLAIQGVSVCLCSCSSSEGRQISRHTVRRYEDVHQSVQGDVHGIVSTLANGCNTGARSCTRFSANPVSSSRARQARS
ncbi:hypothetical protein PF005_g9473 [Phytophthora fragariae]|uniref:Uncharacterized protein n=1 Tax=Phytophthora fragariae TaxID=53985 RepID=A0A6A3SBT2_9STRA|nr:hypothetical protein PF003_g6009 [Phytophthora fragariae]KAE8939586.1 hypothetical protein PF009_g10569 [Phytophthora fragariae]KAE9014020.1 hypothetical protein PF011_g8239 [Phytophthora fragariae]KAE9113788.1 hypothetical protein PF007_g10616 [Phytophthora fragariae]KAE9116684.1 hypothetical protein PF010_g8871 [Phytophthora fragariae]